MARDPKGVVFTSFLARVKANRRKLKVNAMLNGGYEITKDVAGSVGIQEKNETVKVNVLNNEGIDEC